MHYSQLFAVTFTYHSRLYNFTTTSLGNNTNIGVAEHQLQKNPAHEQVKKRVAFRENETPRKIVKRRKK